MKKLLIKLLKSFTLEYILIVAIATLLGLIFVGGVLTAFWTLLISIATIFLFLLGKELWQYSAKTGDYKVGN
jgi:UPF0716 family protein affecting phage T7 exclusion